MPANPTPPESDALAAACAPVTDAERIAFLEAQIRTLTVPETTEAVNLAEMAAAVADADSRPHAWPLEPDVLRAAAEEIDRLRALVLQGTDEEARLRRGGGDGCVRCDAAGFLP